MARTFQRRNRLSAISEPNVTPLIDLAFSLLIIFMITTPLLEQTIPLNLPVQAGAPQPPQEPRYEQIYIVRAGEYIWQEQRVTRLELGDALRNLALQIDPPILHIRADRNIEYQEVVTVLDLIQQNNLTRISLDTTVGR